MIETTLDELVPRYWAFLVDQFGVLMTGGGAYPWAPEALARLGETGKPVILLSNSGKRAAANIARLERFGFDRRSFETVLSSGEAAHAALAARIGTELPRGAAVFLIRRDGDGSAIEGLGLREVETAEEADLVMIAGSEGDRLTLETYREMLAPAAAKGVPCLCTNPDMTMLTGDTRAFGPGRIAQLYQELGGTVEYVGKPHPLIYQVALKKLHGIPANRVLCIGDSPAHDVRGGKAAGFATALVRTGVHEGEDFAEFLADAPKGDRPDYIIPRFEL